MLISREIEGRNFQIFCESWSNSRAWGHRAVLMSNGDRLQDVKVRYYNRTWECWQYQSVAQSAVYNELQEMKTRALVRYKDATGRKRLTKEDKAMIWAGDHDIKILQALYDSLK